MSASIDGWEIAGIKLPALTHTQVIGVGLLVGVMASGLLLGLVFFLYWIVTWRRARKVHKESQINKANSYLRYDSPFSIVEDVVVMPVCMQHNCYGYNHVMELQDEEEINQSNIECNNSLDREVDEKDNMDSIELEVCYCELSCKEPGISLSSSRLLDRKTSLYLDSKSSTEHNSVTSQFL